MNFIFRKTLMTVINVRDKQNQNNISNFLK